MAANNTFRSSITLADVQAVSPALANYTRTAVVDGVWNRAGLTRRDRSIRHGGHIDCTHTNHRDGTLLCDRPG